MGTSGSLLSSHSMCHSSFALTIETLTRKSNPNLVNEDAKSVEGTMCASDHQEALAASQSEVVLQDMCRSAHQEALVASPSEVILQGEAFTGTLAAESHPSESGGAKSLRSSSSRGFSSRHDPSGK